MNCGTSHNVRRPLAIASQNVGMMKTAWFFRVCQVCQVGQACQLFFVGLLEKCVRECLAGQTICDSNTLAQRATESAVGDFGCRGEMSKSDRRPRRGFGTKTPHGTVANAACIIPEEAKNSEEGVLATPLQEGAVCSAKRRREAPG
jgi:hypothetical protein